MKGAVIFVGLIFTVLLLEFAAIASAGVYALTRDGFIDVGVRQNGQGFTIPVPASLFRHATVHVATCHGRRVDLDELRAAVGDLEQAPDSTFFEAREHDQHVVIRKSGGAMHIEVTEPGQQIEVTVPVSVFRMISTS
jgi:hypothetical protein